MQIACDAIQKIRRVRARKESRKTYEEKKYNKNNKILGEFSKCNEKVGRKAQGRRRERIRGPVQET